MKFIESVLILALVACFAGSCACISSGAPVTDITNFAYQVSVQGPVIMCSGAIISPNKILTTATCVKNLTPTQVEVWVGSNQYYSGGTKYSIENILINPSFNPSTYDSNLAILTTTTSFVFSSTVQMITLASALPAADIFSTVTAYGASDTDMTLPDYLQKADLVNYSVTRCNTLKPGRLTSSMFCAGDLTGNKDMCAADQGAPFVYNNALVGIYSWGASCGLAAPNPNSPVFNSIPYFKSWITANIET